MISHPHGIRVLLSRCEYQSNSPHREIPQRPLIQAASQPALHNPQCLLLLLSLNIKDLRVEEREPEL